MPTGVLLDWIAGHKLITEWPTKCTLSEASEPDLEQTTAKQLRTGHSLPRKSQYRLPAMWTVWACIAFWVSLLIRYNLSSGNYGIHFFILFFGGKDYWHYWNCAIYLQCYNHDAYDQTSNQRHLLFRSSTWWILFSHLSDLLCSNHHDEKLKTLFLSFKLCCRTSSGLISLVHFR